MSNNYYIRLIVSGEECYDWKFEKRESRNATYDKVLEKFESEKVTNTPYIEIELDDDNNNYSTMQATLKISPEIKDEVIKYIDTLV